MSLETENPRTAAAPRLGRILVASLFAALILVAWIGLPFEIPYIGYGLASAFVFQLAVRPRKWEILAVALAASALVWFDSFIVHAGGAANLRVSTCFGMLGLMSFLVLGLRAVWAEAEEQAQLKSILIPAAALTFFTFGSQSLLNLAGLLFPKTLDLYAYAFDGSLGFQPSFVLGRIFRDSSWVNAFGHFTYYALPIPMALVYAAHLRRKKTPPLFILEILMAAGLIGYFLYLAFPAAGPAYVTGPAFPGSPLPLAALHQLDLRPVPLSWQIPRNAMPSLHMGWMLLIWFNCKPFSRWARWLAFAFLLITVCDTLGTGEHYLIDLIVAFPFAVSIQALCTRWVPLRSRLLPLAGGMSVVLAWMILLRYATSLFLLSPVIPWICVIATTAISAVWMREVLSLPDAEPEMTATLMKAASAASR